MGLKRRLRKVCHYHLTLFILPIIFLIYYGWWAAAELNQRPDNPMLSSPLSRRGAIIDRHDQFLAVSKNNKRLYPFADSLAPLIGYSLHGESESGLEAILKDKLSPPLAPKSLWGALSRDGQKKGITSIQSGQPIELSLDATLQQDLYRLLQPRAGALVIGEIESGLILASVSSPSFNPSKLGQNWQELKDSSSSPLVERVGSGLYPVRALNGSKLLTPAEAANHAWFRDNPFPLYPGSSPALELEDELLFSPLMLLQIASKASSQSQALRPTLIKPAILNRSPESWDPASKIPYFKGQYQVEGWSICALQGAKFHQSPPFKVILGRVRHKAPLALALVVEDGDSYSDKLLQQIIARIEKG